MILKQNVLFSLTFSVLFKTCCSDLFDDIEDFDLGDLAKAFSPTCKFTCKNGAKPRLNPLHKPSSNGCGSFGLKVEMGDDLPDMTPCCDKLDVYYDTCNGSVSKTLSMKVEMGDDLPDMTPCCDKHDVCYDTCNKDREKCDDTFHACLKQLCQKHYSKHRTKKIEDCKKAAMMMYSSTTALGCTSFLSAQENACACDDVKKAGSKAGTRNEL